MRQWTFVPLGDRAITVDLSRGEPAQLRDLVQSLDAALHDNRPAGVTAHAPAIQSLTLHYDPTRTTFEALTAHIDVVINRVRITSAAPHIPVVIPVCYGGEYGPDLDVVARMHDTSPQAIVDAHTAGDYLVAMIGFLPGFPYLEGLHAALHTPRRATPRTGVPAGSVGIGGSSTGVYPFTSPGGWHLIGRTPITLFDARRAQPSLLKARDRVRFVAIAPDEWRDHSDNRAAAT